MIRAVFLGASQLLQPAMIRLAIRSGAITLLVFLFFGAGLYFALEAVLDSYLGQMAPGLSVLISVVVMLLGMWFAFRMVAIAVLQFFADEIVNAVEQRHYPGCHIHVVEPGLGRSAKMAIFGLLRGLLFNALALPVYLLLLVTGVGAPLVFLFVNAILVGRDLNEMVVCRYAHLTEPKPSEAEPAADDVAVHPIPALQRFLLGLIATGLFLIPLVNLLAPIMVTATATHMVHGRKGRK